MEDTGVESDVFRPGQSHRLRDIRIELFSGKDCRPVNRRRQDSSRSQDLGVGRIGQD